MTTTTHRAIALLRYAANKTWISGYAREHSRFVSSLDSVRKTQSELLLQLIAANADSRFGRRHSFAKLRTVEDFQAAVPVSDYESMRPDIEAIARGESAILTTEKVTRFQPTSGAFGARKLIPWTASLGKEFLRGIAPWLHQLYTSHPCLLRGSAYWSISPPVPGSDSLGPIPVGFENDAAYLGFFGRQFFNLVSAVPSQVSQTRDLESFKDQTMAALLADEDLTLISVWSPSFLTLLIEHFLRRPMVIIELIARRGGTRSSARAKFLRELFRTPLPMAAWTRLVWPRLKLISCWTAGPSELQARQLYRSFPGVEIQGKGLLATEAFVSLPFCPDHDPVLALRSHFFEFQDSTTGKCHLADELSLNSRYRVLVTSSGGLYRYCLGDWVEVTGFLREAPCLAFLGREGGVSDHVGEKLNPIFVQQTLTRGLTETGLSSSFYLLAPVYSEASIGYVLFIKLDTQDRLSVLRETVETGLRESFHYDCCRRLGQLHALRIFVITQDLPTPASTYEETIAARGVKLGDIKATPLDSIPGWETKFQGHFHPLD